MVQGIFPRTYLRSTPSRSQNALRALERSMEERRDPGATRPAASFGTQANALLRKNLVFQKRRWRMNACLVIFPALLCILLFLFQVVINRLNDTAAFKCGCKCVPISNSSNACETRCGIEYSKDIQVLACPITSPPELPVLMQVPRQKFRAVNIDGQFPGFPDPACHDLGICPLVFLYTGRNRSIADAVMNNMLTGDVPSDLSNPLSTLVPGTDHDVPRSFFLETGLQELTLLQPNCFLLTNASVPCSSTRMLWRDRKETIQDTTYNGYWKGDAKKSVNEIPVAYDFQATSLGNLEVTISYNVSFRDDVTRGSSPVLRVARSMNLVAKAFIRTMLNSAAELPYSFIKDMPKPETKLLINFSTLLGPLAYMWVVQLLLPVILVSLVYEKERNLRMMMRMHGLGDGPYWLISYLYFLAFSTLYVFCFVLFGSVIGLSFFRENSYTIQFIFFMVYINLQIAIAFFAAAVLSHVSTATVTGYLYVFGMGLAGQFIFSNLIEDSSVSRAAVIVLELVPGFSLFRGLYELSEYATQGERRGSTGMRWKNLWDSENGMREILIIMSAEWVVFLLLALYLDQVVASGSGVKKHPLFFLGRTWERPRSVPIPSTHETDVDKPDVANERAVIENLRGENEYSIICNDLKKVYPGKDGNAEKYAVSGLSLGIKRGECFGMLGPNGAGKTTSINMMIGFLTPSSGKAFVVGMDISKDMDKVYAIMGVCPQHDLLWETLTGREHLLFYGRLKNLSGRELQAAVKSSLKSVNLSDAANRQAGKYSGGMKRRLSVAISLIGNPKAVYMDEPSTGLDPASRRNLWNAIKRAKQNCAIILTTHSMEEAEALCDRVGIFVNGQLQCIGSPNDLKSRYAGSYIFTITSDASKEDEVANMVQGWSADDRRIYVLSGTQKFELPKQVSIARVFRDVRDAKSRLGIQAWGLTDTTLENVFIKVAT